MNIRVRGMLFVWKDLYRWFSFSFCQFQLSKTEDLYTVQLFYFMSAVKIKKQIGILRKSPDAMPWNKNDTMS